MNSTLAIQHIQQIQWRLDFNMANNLQNETTTDNNYDFLSKLKLKLGIYEAETNKFIDSKHKPIH